MAIVAKAVPQAIPRIAPREDLNPYRIAQIQFDIAAEYLKLDPGLRQILRTPKRILEVSVPTKMDNGQIKAFACNTISRADRPRAASDITPQ
jgi:hypothetical protein